MPDKHDLCAKQPRILSSKMEAAVAAFDGAQDQLMEGQTDVLVDDPPIGGRRESLESQAKCGLAHQVCIISMVSSPIRGYNLLKPWHRSFARGTWKYCKIWNNFF